MTVPRRIYLLRLWLCPFIADCPSFRKTIVNNRMKLSWILCTSESAIAKRLSDIAALTVSQSSDADKKGRWRWSRAVHIQAFNRPKKNVSFCAVSSTPRHCGSDAIVRRAFEEGLQYFEIVPEREMREIIVDKTQHRRLVPILDLKHEKEMKASQR